MVRLSQIREIFSRRRRAFALTSLIVLLIGLGTYQPPRRFQRIELKFIVSQPPLPSTEEKEEERYNHWVASEYVVFSLSDWANGSTFATDVAESMNKLNYDMDIEDVDDNMYARAVRSQLTLGVLAKDEQQVRDMALIASELLTAQAGQGIPQLQLQAADIFPIDPIADPLVEEVDIDELNASVGSQLSLLLRVLIAIVAGIAAMLILELYDPTIRNRNAIEALQLPILGEIPRS